MEKAYFKIVFLVGIPLLEVFALSLEPSFPRIQNKVFLTGEGYKPSEDITINFEKKIFKTKATLDGTFSTSFFVHPQPGGRKVITVKGKVKLETISFWIKPVMKAYPLRGSRGTRVFIEGEGYPLDERIQVGMGINSCVAFVNPEKGGTFSSSFIIGNLAYGSNTFFTLGKVVFMDEKMAFFMEPDLKVIPHSGSVGSLVTISGTGYSAPRNFEPGEWVEIDFGSHRSVACVRSDKYGSFEVVIPVFLEPSKGALIQASGISSSLKSKTFFEIIPRIKQFPQVAYPTKGVKLAGDGFFINETITLTLEKGMEGTRTLTQTETFFANESGAFSCDFLIDTQPKGIKRVTIRGEFGFCEERMLEIKPFIEVVELDREYGTLTLKGGGWIKEEGVSFSFGGPRYIGATSSDREGSFLVTFKVSGMGEKERIIAEGRKSYEVTIAYWEGRK